MIGCFFILILSAVSGLKITEEEYSRFPRLFHLDDYQRCLAVPPGLYCLGTFTLSAPKNNSNFQLMKAYSALPHNFNRTRIHRGYCVSERCPRERNATLRFERCVAERARRYSLTTRLRAGECTTHQMHQDKAKLAPDATERLFIYALYVILLLNVLGTICDVYSKPGDDKWTLLKCWSVPSNWRKLVNTNDMPDSIVQPLASIQGVRAIAVILVLGAHMIGGRLKMYSYHPHIIEQYFQGAMAIVIFNSFSLMHIFVMISSFLTTYIIIVISEKYDLSIKLLPLAVFKRMIRVSPTYLFMVGYAATWWYRLGDGPLWSSLVGSERNNCRAKFWAHAFYVNNLIDNHKMNSEFCLTPTWVLAADLQTNIVVSGIALIMAKWGRKALKIHALACLFLCVLNTAVAYANGWKPIIFNNGPEKLHNSYAGDSSISHLYMSSWILLPACFIGMFCAHLHVELQKVGFKPSDHKWVKLLFNLVLPVFFLGVLSGIYVKKYNSPLSMALNIGFFRPMFCIITGFGLVVSFRYQEHVLYKIFAWKFWHILSRLSLPVLMVHWIVLITMAATTRHAMSSTYYDVMTDWIVLLVASYAISVPVSVLLERPAQRFLETLVFRQKLKTN